MGGRAVLFSPTRFVRRTLKKIDIAITTEKKLQRLKEKSRAGDLVGLLLELPQRHKKQLLKYLSSARGQFGQDLFVLSELEFKRDGFFVDFGATDGFHASNSYLLEKEFGWRGIVAEPARGWHAELKRNRSCSIETNCVWSESNRELTFVEAINGDFSTIDAFKSVDYHSRARRNGRKYKVNTISLMDLLKKYNAPQEIDFLSIDTEGSEFEILNSFDFNRYRFGVITCEHNFSPSREKVSSLLTANGYVRKFEDFSNVDDWYVSADCNSPKRHTGEKTD
jgi:FkbM family methyltransferase